MSFSQVLSYPQSLFCQAQSKMASRVQRTSSIQTVHQSLHKNAAQPQEVSIPGEYSKFPSSHFSLITDFSQRRLLVPVPNDTTCSNKRRLFGRRSNGLLLFLPTGTLKGSVFPLSNDCSKRVCTQSKYPWPPSTLVKQSLDTDSACPTACTAGLIL